jgi:histidinol-phosphatase (PHP family)
MAAVILYDSHMHTPLCKHAWGKPDEYAAAAEKQGLKGINITCHNPGPDGWSQRVRMRMDQFGEYIDMVQEARDAWAGRIDVQLGLECDYIPGMEAWLERIIAGADLQFVLGSVHPQLPYYKEAFFHGDVLEFQRTYFDHLALSAETGLFDCLGHPDLVKNVFPDQWQVEAVLDDIRHCLDRIATTGVAMEINTSGLHKEIKQMNPGSTILAEMSQRDIPVVLGSDAHSPTRVGANFPAALELLQEAGYSEINYILARARQQVSLPLALESLQVPHVS